MNRRTESRAALPFPTAGVLFRNPEGYTVSTLSSITDTLLRAGGSGMLYDPRGTIDDGDARVVRALCRAFNVPFIVVDDLDLARRQRVDGVYLSDPANDVAAARAHVPWAAVCIFCGLDIDAAKRAEKGGAACVALGLAGADSQLADGGMALVAQAVARVREGVRVPVAAVGEWAPDKVAEILRAGASLLVLSGTVYGAEHPRQTLLAYINRFPEHEALRARIAR